MKRLTTDKPVSEMEMLELAHNSCYVGEDGSARYRDFDTDIDARELARKLMVDFNIWIPDMIEMTNDEEFDWVILEELSNADVSEKMFADGLIPLFYRNLWAMADLRERLKQYEDAEEQGLFLKLPFELGGTLYDILEFVEKDKYPEMYAINASKVEISRDEEGILYCIDGFDYREKDFGTTLFGSKEEAEAALAKMESEV